MVFRVGILFTVLVGRREWIVMGGTLREHLIFGLDVFTFIKLTTYALFCMFHF